MSESDRVQVYVLLTVGDEAVVRLPDRREVRMPAADIAADVQMPPGELPGRDFTAVLAEQEGRITLSDFHLVNDPRL